MNNNKKTRIRKTIEITQEMRDFLLSKGNNFNALIRGLIADAMEKENYAK